MGQQVFVGLGAYCLYMTSISLKLSPYWVLPVAPFFCAAVAAVMALFLFRLREAYFAIGTWVLSEVVSLAISKIDGLGGERGMGLPTARLIDPRWLEPLTFWISAAIAAAAVAGTYALLRSRVGLGLMTVRDNDVAAASIGVDVWRNRFIAFVIAAAGCGLAGAVSFTATLYVAPSFAFDPNWVVAMMFIVLIGGIGTLEGPILGTIIYFALRELVTIVWGLSAGWYLVGLGMVAIATMLFEPAGLWPIVRDRLGIDWLSVRRVPPAPAPSVAERAAAPRGASSGRARIAQASFVQYTIRHSGPLNGLKSKPRIALPVANTAWRITIGITTTFCTTRSFMRMNVAARLTGSISVSAARQRRSYSSFLNRLTFTPAHLFAFWATSHEQNARMNACGSG
jgi:branched-chain amino acid transport system permease protein